MTLILDAGALVAIDRRDRLVGAILDEARRTREPVRCSSAVIGQVWRHGARQANLARILRGVESVPLDDFAARRAGELLASSRTSDVVDAHVALLAVLNDGVLTSDPDDVAHLLGCRGVGVTVITV